MSELRLSLLVALLRYPVLVVCYLCTLFPVWFCEDSPLLFIVKAFYNLSSQFSVTQSLPVGGLARVDL